MTVNLTAAHKGYFVFRLCPVVTDEVEVTKKFLNQYPLEIVNGSSGNRFKYNLGNQETTNMENETFRACADIMINKRDDEMSNEIDVTEKAKMTKDTIDDK